jgi:hypothetical protein
LTFSFLLSSIELIRLVNREERANETVEKLFLDDQVMLPNESSKLC